MILVNVKQINGEDLCISVQGERFFALTGNDAGERIDFNDAVAFPGLINSHDHLDFNCFSPLGNKKYNNYREWGNDIHASYKKEIDAVLKIPAELRNRWGMYKNLLGGVTTVVNHGRYVDLDSPLISIKQDLQNLHSVAFEKRWRLKLNNPFRRNELCVIHAGEGSDDESIREIDTLLQWNLLEKKLVTVHGVAMKRIHAKYIHAHVWCPESNRQLLDAHADIKSIAELTQLLFGTDSTLTGHWDIRHHLRLARSLRQVSDEKLFESVTSTAAAIWNTSTGSLSPGKYADMVIAKASRGGNAWDRFFALDAPDIMMVMHYGKIRLFDESLYDQLKRSNYLPGVFHPVIINGSVKYLEGDLPALMEEIRKYYPAATFPCDIKSAVYA